MGGFTDEDLRARAGVRSFARGQGYLDAVVLTEVGDGWVTASVQGGEPYEVELDLDSADGPAGRCDCPCGLDGHFCKHLVAVGLTVLAQQQSLPRLRARARTRAQHMDTWLAGLSHGELLGLIRELIGQDGDLRRRLELRAAGARGDLAEVRTRIRELLDPGPFAQYGYVAYADARAYGEQAAQVVAAITALTATGRAKGATELSREALRQLRESYEQVDDSDGLLGEVAAGLADAHLAACRAARPDPDGTARWLVGHLLSDLYDLTDIDPLDYEDVLGAEGLSTVRKLAVEAWQGNRTGWAEKYLMERLARASGAVDGVIAVHAVDLSPDGSTHLTIAHELDAAGRPDEALDWAERGIAASQDLDRSPGLVDYLCSRYTRAGRLLPAAELRRTSFAAQPTLAAYQQLRDAARAAGSWRAERESALALLRADATADRRPRYGGPLLVDVLLDDQDLDAAWQAATETGAHDTQWLALADLARATRPADALGIYRRSAEPLLQQTGNPVYEKLTGLLLSMRDCHRLLGTEEEFAAFLTALRAGQKRKRNLLRALDAHGL